MHQGFATTRRFVLIGLGLAGFTLAAAPAHAGLVGLSSSRPGSVYSIDATTGAATLIVDLSNTDRTSLVGLEVLDGTLYASDVAVPNGGGRLRFGTIDLATGAFTAITDQAGSNNWQSLAADQDADLIYTVELTTTDLNLVAITPGGAVSVIGATGRDIKGLAFDDANNILYGVDPGSLYTIDVGTGAATLVGGLGVATEGRHGLAYDPTTATLYLNAGNLGGGGNLYTLDVATGAATLVGPNGPTAGIGIDGLAFFPTVTAVPEPSTFALAAIGGAGLLGYGWRRRRRAE